MPKVKPFKLPKSAAACADLLYTTREERLTKQKEVDGLADREKQLNDFFVNSMPKDSTGIAGRVAVVQLSTKPIPTVEDWDKFYAFVAKTKGFHFLQRRLSDTAVKEVWDAKKQVPGVGRFNVIKVSCTKIK